MIRGRDLYYRSRPLIVAITNILRFLPLPLRYGWLAWFRGTPGLLGVGLRYIGVRSLAKECGENIYVGPYAFLSYLENCTIGDHVSIREMCVIGCRGGVDIGSNVSIAHGSSVLSTEHTYKTDSLIRDAPAVLKRTIIEDDVWVGAGVRVTAGVKIGKGSVIGANAVVADSIPPYSIAVGVPAEVIDTRPHALSDNRNI